MGKASRYNRRVFICRTAGTQALRSKTSPDTISSTPGHVAVNPLPSVFDGVSLTHKLPSALG